MGLNSESSDDYDVEDSSSDFRDFEHTPDASGIMDKSLQKLNFAIINSEKV